MWHTLLSPLMRNRTERKFLTYSKRCRYGSSLCINTFVFLISEYRGKAKRGVRDHVSLRHTPSPAVNCCTLSFLFQRPKAQHTLATERRRAALHKLVSSSADTRFKSLPGSTRSYEYDGVKQKLWSTAYRGCTWNQTTIPSNRLALIHPKSQEASRRPGFNHRSVQVGFVVTEVTMGLVPPSPQFFCTPRQYASVNAIISYSVYL